jgi:hypothetical protein
MRKAIIHSRSDPTSVPRRFVRALVACLVACACQQALPLPSPSQNSLPNVSAVRPVSVPPQTAIVPLSCDAPVSYGTEIRATAGVLSPDQRTVALAADLNPFFRYPAAGYKPDLEQRRIQLFDLETHSVRDVARGASPLAWSGSGRYLAFYEPQGSGVQVPTDLIVFDLQAGHEIARLRSEPFAAGIGWAGDALLYQVASTLRSWTPGSDVAALHADGTPVMIPSPDGLAVLLSTYSGDAPRPERTQVVDLATQASTELPGAWEAQWSPVGHRLLVSYVDRSELRDEDGRVTTYPYPVSYWTLHWAPDGRQPLFVEPPAVRHVVEQGPLLYELITIDRVSTGVRLEFLRQARFVADGHLLVAIHADGYSAPTFRPYLCRPTPAVSPTPRPATQTLYYGESNEPWAATLAGGLPDTWRDQATASLAAAGIHPTSLEIVRPIPASSFAGNPAQCGVSPCANGWVLAISIPFSERERAFARCFLIGDGITYIPAYPARAAGAAFACDAF